MYLEADGVGVVEHSHDFQTVANHLRKVPKGVVKTYLDNRSWRHRAGELALQFRTTSLGYGLSERMSALDTRKQIQSLFPGAPDEGRICPVLRVVYGCEERVPEEQPVVQGVNSSLWY